MFDPNALAQMAFPDDITVGEAISSTCYSEMWERFKLHYPTVVLRFCYRETREPVDLDMTMGAARRLIKEKIIVVSIVDGSEGLMEDA